MITARSGTWERWVAMEGDVRYALRQFRRAPGFALTAVVVLALGVGASVSIFCFVNAALLKPLPYEAPSRLVGVFESTASCADCTFSYPDYLDWQRNNAVFRSLEIWQPTAYLWRSGGGVESLRAGRVSGGFFAALGVKPEAGRLFTKADDRPDAARTVILPYSTWQRFFGGRPDAVGQTINLDGQVYEVIGVLPRSFQFAPRAAELWVTVHDTGTCETDRSCRSFYGLARLKDGVSVAAAQADTSTMARQLEKQYPISNKGQGARVLPLSEVVAGDLRPMLLVLLAGSVLLLMIACVNVGSLFLVRAESRRREMAVRGALGASRGRLTGQLMMEAMLLAAVSVSLGLGGAQGAVSLLAALIPERVLRGMPYFQSVGFDGRVWGFAGAVALLVWGVCTVAPLARLATQDLRGGLASGARASSSAWRRLGSNLVVVELALAVVLLASAGVLGKSFYRILHVDLDFEPDHLATLEVDANTGYDTPARKLALARGLMGTVREIPGVKSAGIVDALPVTCNCDAAPYRVVGRAWDGEQHEALSRRVSAGYFETLGAHLRSGRSFAETDDGAHPAVAVINRSMARGFFGGEDPVGKVIGDAELTQGSLHRVIGVVDDVREGALNEPIRPAVYYPLSQEPANYFFVVARTVQEPVSALPEMVAGIHRLDGGIGVRNEFSMTEHIHDGAASYLRSSAARLVGGFAGCALVLGVIGLYGVIAYSVSQRTQEIGVRMALGARRSTIGWLVLGEAARLVVIGMGLGLVGAMVLGQFLRSLLFGVRPWDVGVLAGVCTVLTVAALMATGIPARRAAGVEPMEALRRE